MESDTMTVQPAPPPDDEPGWDHVPAEHYPPETQYSLKEGDRIASPGCRWSAAASAVTCSFWIDVWIRRASHPERVRWLEEQRRVASMYDDGDHNTPACPPEPDVPTPKVDPFAADRERVVVTSITSDTMTVQPQAPPDDEPGWDHVPYERVGDSGGLKTSLGDRFFSSGMWHSVCVARSVMHPDTLLRRASHPERVRWLEERNRAVNVDSAIVTKEDARDAVRRAVLVCARDDAPKGALDATVAVPVDPFASVRAEAKRMMDDGADPRVVLGALDECVRRRDPAMWKLQLAYYTVEATKSVARRLTRTQFESCYHGNRAGSCGWCALSRDRSDARVVASHEPAWDTADCEGE